VTSGKVRPFLKDDIPWAADLYNKVFLSSDRPSSPELRDYFHEVFFESPFCQDDLSSLVYQEGSGKRIGFIGVLPRRMQLEHQSIRVAISFHFMVEPESRSTLAGVQLLKAFFEGPQDLSLTDGAGTLGRQVWEVLGGKTALLYSLYWTRVLRPGQFVLSLMKKRKLPAPLVYASAPIWKIIDALMARARPMHFERPPGVMEEDLSASTLLANLAEFTGLYSLRPDYDDGTLEWSIQHAARRQRFGQLQKVAVRKEGGKLAGWYLYYLNPGGTSELVQFTARKDCVQLLMDHFFFHAWSRGAAAVSGRMDPRFAQEFSDNYCFFSRRGSWMLVHSKKPEILEVIYRGNAFLSRLDGEWCALYDGT
jgi:hypothetical protein